jgi:hypothetical protein
MRPLSAEQQTAFNRYEKCSLAVERFLLLEASAVASNKLLSTLEASFAGQSLNNRDYLFLQLISEKRGRNLHALSDVRETRTIFIKLRDSALAASSLGDSE